MKKIIQLLTSPFKATKKIIHLEIPYVNGQMVITYKVAEEIAQNIQKQVGSEYLVLTSPFKVVIEE